jgi:hypothetical protein
MMNTMPIKFLIGLITATSLAIGWFAFGRLQEIKVHGGTAPEAVSIESVEPVKTPTIVEDAPAAGPEIPEALNLEMVFYSQAPFGNWDYPWQEACEEASILLVANEYNKMNLTREDFNEELLRLVEWEKVYFGSYEHTTVAQTAEMLKLEYGLDSAIHENPSFEDVQKIIANGHLIVAPFAGKLLGNPNFRNGGPNYHMLVIKGYNSQKMQIITSDVGTRNGENYVYSWETIALALHNWHDTDITLGKKLIIEVL